MSTSHLSNKHSTSHPSNIWNCIEMGSNGDSRCSHYCYVEAGQCHHQPKWARKNSFFFEIGQKLRRESYIITKTNRKPWTNSFDWIESVRCNSFSGVANSMSSWTMFFNVMSSWTWSLNVMSSWTWFFNAMSFSSWTSIFNEYEIGFKKMLAWSGIRGQSTWKPYPRRSCCRNRGLPWPNSIAILTDLSDIIIVV